ncbi:MAG: hypothetical protein KGH94_04305 [Candidatus Micrarchaeota archaeon]|nr:hypothetical protein [Candidatus Micrarchaeota archaeon]
MVKRRTRERRYRLVKCGYCKGSGKDESRPSIFSGDATCKTCKGVGKVKVLIKSK